MSTDPLKRAIDLSRAGKREEARELLMQLITADVHNESAWLWYSYTLPTHADRIKALEECLYYNPRCERALSGLAALKEDHPQTTDSVNGLPPSAPRLRRSLLLAGGVVGLLLSCVTCGVLASARLRRSSSPSTFVSPSAEISVDTAAKVVKLRQIEADAPGEVTWSPDGNTLAAADYEGIHLYNANDLSEILLLGSEGVNTVAFSPDGQTAASDWKQNKVRLWRVPEGHLIDTLQCRPGSGVEAIMGQVVHVEFSPDGTMLASARLDNRICLWWTGGQLLHTLEHPDFVAKTAF